MRDIKDNQTVYSVYQDNVLIGRDTANNLIKKGIVKNVSVLQVDYNIKSKIKAEPYAIRKKYFQVFKNGKEDFEGTVEEIAKNYYYSLEWVRHAIIYGKPFGKEKKYLIKQKGTKDYEIN